MTHPRSQTGMKYMLAGGSAIIALGLLMDFRAQMPLASGSVKDLCQAIVQSKARLSRDALSKLLAVPEHSQKGKVRQVVQEPYCILSSLPLAAGATTQREAYPLAFDPQTWLVVLYEGEKYAGYSFNFRH